MSKDIRLFIKNFANCTIIKSNKPLKPLNKQIISYFPLERLELDLTYLSKIYPKNASKYKYIFSIVDHFSKYAKAYLLVTKEAKEVLNYLKKFIDEYGKPNIVQSDNGGEITANIIKNYLKEEGILFINSGVSHPQTNGVVEAFNKNIINKLEYTLLDKNNKFDIEMGILKAEEIYNNVIHTTTKIEPVKAFKFKKEEDINKLITNVIKSQNYVYKSYEGLKKGEKCLLNDNFQIKNNILNYI